MKILTHRQIWRNGRFSKSLNFGIPKVTTHLLGIGSFAVILTAKMRISHWRLEPGTEEAVLANVNDQYRSKSSFSLRFVFGIVISCSLFFALFSLSSTAAIALTVLVTPAIIRTGNIESQFRQYSIELNWRQRSYFFLSSLGLMLNSVFIGLIAFAAVCIGCTLLGYGFALAFGSAVTSPMEVAFVGAASGVVWGIIAGIVTVGWYWNLNWIPDIDFKDGEAASSLVWNWNPTRS